MKVVLIIKTKILLTKGVTMNNRENINTQNGFNDTFGKPKKYKGYMVGNLAVVFVIIIIIIIAKMCLNSLVPPPPNKEDIHDTIVNNKVILEDAVLQIKEIKQNNTYISVIEHTKFYPADENPSIKGLFTGGLLDEQYKQTPIENKTLEKLFLNIGVEQITIFDKYIEFSLGGVGSTYYCGAVCTDDGNPVGFDGSDMQIVADGRGWSWQEVNGNNKYYTEKIIDNWYFYEMRF